MGTDIVLAIILGLDVAMSSGDGKSHPGQYGRNGSMAREPDLSPRW